jgi:hypothetical protein
MNMATTAGHGVPSSGRARGLLADTGRWLLDNSVVLYLAAIASHRVWIVLNSDVGELLRRHTH